MLWWVRWWTNPPLVTIKPDKTVKSSNFSTLEFKGTHFMENYWTSERNGRGLLHAYAWLCQCSSSIRAGQAVNTSSSIPSGRQGSLDLEHCHTGDLCGKQTELASGSLSLRVGLLQTSKWTRDLTGSSSSQRGPDLICLELTRGCVHCYTGQRGSLCPWMMETQACEVRHERVQ